MDDLPKEKLFARLRLRGMNPEDDPEFIRMAGWTRLTFALCTAGAGIATVSSSVPVLVTMMGIAVIGAAMERHPFDYVYNGVIRRFTGTLKLPTNGVPTRFACTIGAVWFLALAVLFHNGFDNAGYVLGAMFVAVGSLVSTTHFCIPSLIFQFLFGDRSLIIPSITGRARV